MPNLKMRESNATTAVLTSESSPLLKTPEIIAYGSDVSSLSSDGSILNAAIGPDDDVETADPTELACDTAKELPGRRHVAKTIAILLIGILVAEIDGSIVMATHPLIASEFNDLANSTWLITGFALAGAVTQPLVRPSCLSTGMPADALTTVRETQRHIWQESRHHRRIRNLCDRLRNSVSPSRVRINACK